MQSILNKILDYSAESRSIPAYLPALACTFLMGVGFSLTMTFIPLFGMQQIGMSAWMLGIILTVSSMFEVGVSSWIGRLSDSNAMSGIALPLLTTANLHAADQTVGWLVGLNALLQIPFMLGFGLLANRYGNSLIMKTAGVFGILYFVLSASVDSTWTLAAYQILNAAYVSIILGVGLNYCQELIPESPGTATTLYSNATTIGLMLGGFMAGSIGEWMGNRAIFIACAALAGLGLVLINSTGFMSNKKASMKKAETLPNN